MESNNSRLPDSYARASWRNTTPYDAGADALGIGFNTASGEVLRVSLDWISAVHLAESLADYLGCGVQSPRSSDSPMADESCPPGKV